MGGDGAASERRVRPICPLGDTSASPRRATRWWRRTSTHAIEEYCRYKGLELSKIYSDLDYSGRRGAKPRPSLNELIDDRQRYAAVVTPKLSRFGRSLRDLAELFDVFDRDGIGLVFLDLDIDTRTSAGRLVRNVMASLAEYESDLLSERWQDTYGYLVRSGRRSGGHSVPLGYTYDPTNKNYEVVPQQAAVVREIFARYLAGESVNALVKDLNVRRVPTKSGGIWRYRTVAQMLECEFFAGLTYYRGQEYEGKWEPIVSTEDFEAARALRRRSRASYVPSRERDRAEHLLSGLLRCAQCGSRLWRQARASGGDAYYFCPHTRSQAVAASGRKCGGASIKEARAEQIIVESFFDTVGGLHAAHVHSNGKAVLRRNSAAGRRDVASRLADLDRRMGNAVRLSAAASTASARRAYEREVERLARDRERAEAEDGAERARRAEMKRLDDEVNQLRNLSDLGSVWSKATVGERRQMLQLAIESASPTGMRKGPSITWREWVTRP